MRNRTGDKRRTQHRRGDKSENKLHIDQLERKLGDKPKKAGDKLGDKGRDKPKKAKQGDKPKEADTAS